jgi:hypothetical protein
MGARFSILRRSINGVYHMYRTIIGSLRDWSC